MTRSVLAYPLGSTFESGRFVLNAENVPVRAVLYVMKDAVLLSLPVLRSAGLKMLKDTEVNIGRMNAEEKNRGVDG